MLHVGCERTHKLSSHYWDVLTLLKQDAQFGLGACAKDCLKQTTQKAIADEFFRSSPCLRQHVIKSNKRFVIGFRE
jgi:hypothetical protein